jgi:F-type H+-transporting ATPase subunit c
MDANVAIGIGLALGFGGGGVGIGQGIAVNGAMNGMARQPDLAKYISNQMLIGLIFPELAALLAFAGAIMLMGKVSTPTNGTSMIQHEQKVPGVSAAPKSIALLDGSRVQFSIPR